VLAYNRCKGRLLSVERRAPEQVENPIVAALRTLGYWALTFLCCVTASGARAADPQPYRTLLEFPGSSDIADVLRSSSLLMTLQDSAPVPPFGLITRASGDIERLTTAINSFGYYGPHIDIRVAGLPVADPALPRLLDATPPEMPVTVRIGIEPGPLYRLRKISIAGMVPPGADQVLHLSPGVPAVSADIIAAQARLLTTLQEQGYAFADVAQPVAYPDDENHVLDLVFEVQPGPKVNIGVIDINGVKNVEESFARDALSIHPGELYKPSAIEAARQELLKTGVFAGVTIRAADHPSEDGTVDLIVEVEERAAHAVSVAGTYSTDLGVSLSGTWSHRNLLGNAEQLNVTAAGTGLWGNATEDIGYQLSAQFIKPLFLRHDQELELDLSAVQQDLLAYKQRAETAASSLKRKFSTLWSGTAGINLTHDVVSQKGLRYNYQLLGLPLTVSYDSTGLLNPLLDPAQGLRARFQVTPTLALGNQNPIFFALQAGASGYFDFSTNGRSVLAFRGLVASVVGASNFDLPPDQRLYAGGSATVRGFKYQSIGPLFPDGDPIGGTALDAASIEFRQRVFGDYGAAVFLDAGQVSTERVPFTGTLRTGAGFGIRYYSPIGVVRADVAVPLKRSPGGDSFEVYIGLGQAF
jgi:translocation and assembly module TamA